MALETQLSSQSEAEQERLRKLHEELEAEKEARIAHVQKMQRRGNGDDGGNVDSHAALLSLSVEGTAASASWRTTHGPRKG